MRIIDTFMFSEPYEADVLWVKLNVENIAVDEWVIVENSYTFQGNYKGYFLNDLLRKDTRFKIFLHKINVIETDYKFREIFEDEKENYKIGEKETFSAEFKQREASKEYILSNYTDSDWLIISDTDECIDLTNDKHVILRSKIKNSSSEIVSIPGIKYCFDYNNRVYSNRSTPIVRLSCSTLKSNNGSFGTIRKSHCIGTFKWSKELLFEYSFCFSEESIEKKLNSFSHVGMNLELWTRGLILNCLTLRNGEYPNIFKVKNWFELIKLDLNNSPEFVLDNFDKLRTGIVKKDYKKRRIEELPKYFTWFNSLKLRILRVKIELSRNRRLNNIVSFLRG